MTALQRLFLNNNQLTGNGHTSIYQSIRNKKYYVSIGPIPKQLGNCKALTDLYLNNNVLNGNFCIYQSIRNKKYYEYIGSIPTELGNCKALTTLWLNENKLTGEWDFLHEPTSPFVTRNIMNT